MQQNPTHSGATSGSESFRSANPPIPIEVRESGHQTPRGIKVNGHWRRVISIADLCNVDEEWWRERPIVRMYYRVNLEDSRQITVPGHARWGGYRQNA